MDKVTSDILNRKIDNIDEIDSKVFNKLEPSEKQFLAVLLDGVDDLDITDGLIADSDRNLQIINKLINNGEKVFFGSSYVNTVKLFASLVDIQNDLTLEYFSSFLDDFTFEKQYAKVFERSKDIAIDFLAKDNLRANYIKPIKEGLNRSVIARVTKKDMINYIRDLNRKQEGLRVPILERYVSGMARDSFSVYDRTVTTAIADNLDLQWYRYSSGKVSDSREFCLSRQGKYYHRSEVEGWASLKWQGQYAGTNKQTIFVFCGGYNCMHILAPVSEKQVPKSDLDRIKKPEEAKQADIVSGEITDVYEVKSDPKGQIKDSLEAINKVHKVDGLSKIPIRYDNELAKKGVSSGYFQAVEYKNPNIPILPKNISLNKKVVDSNTIIHEIGHHIDLEAIANASRTNPKLKELRKDLANAFEKSENHKKIILNKFIYGDAINYLTNDREMFARFYAKYIAEESGIVSLSKDLADKTNAFAGSFYDFSDADYKMLKPLLENIFREMKWID
jgi:hypothetical protein